MKKLTKKERWNKAEKRESDGPFFSYLNDETTFANRAEMETFLYDYNGWHDTDLTLEDMCPYLAEANYIKQIYDDDLTDHWPENMRSTDDLLSKELIDALEKLNKIISNHPPISYRQSKYGLKL